MTFKETRTHSNDLVLRRLVCTVRTSDSDAYAAVLTSDSLFL